MRYMLKLIFDMYADVDAEPMAMAGTGHAGQSGGASAQPQEATSPAEDGIGRPAVSISSSQWGDMNQLEPSSQDAAPLWSSAPTTPKGSSVLIKRPSWKADDSAPICPRCGLSFTIVRYVGLQPGRSHSFLCGALRSYQDSS
jgi:hypothetical protein